MRFRAAHLAAALLCSCLSAFAQPPQTATRLDGHRVPLLPANAKAAVLFFVATDCPISNRYQPEILRIQQEFSPRHVAFWFVYPNLTETVPGIRAHRADFAPIDGATHVLLDPGLALVHLTGAKITPEAVILLPSAAGLIPVYAGRIDDRYLSIGNERPQATHHDLEDAIAAATTGRPILPPGGPTVGCSIVTIR